MYRPAAEESLASRLAPPEAATATNTNSSSSRWARNAEDRNSLSSITMVAAEEVAAEVKVPPDPPSSRAIPTLLL